MADETNPARVFRVRYGIDTSSNGSRGEWKLYSDMNALKEDLLIAYLEVTGKPGRGRSDRHKWLIAREWRNFFKKTTETYPRVNEIYAVEQLVDGGWVEIQPEFVDPAVVLVGVR